jgi:hypothetical protein
VRFGTQSKAPGSRKSFHITDVTRQGRRSEVTHTWHRREKHCLFTCAATFDDYLLEFVDALLDLFQVRKQGGRLLRGVPVYHIKNARAALPGSRLPLGLDAEG